MNFAKCLRTPFLQNTSGGLLLYSLKNKAINNKKLQNYKYRDNEATLTSTQWNIILRRISMKNQAIAQCRSSASKMLYEEVVKETSVVKSGFSLISSWTFSLDFFEDFQDAFF